MPGLAAAGGLAGFALRRWQLADAYDPVTQLFLRGRPATWALLLLASTLALTFLLLCQGGRTPEDFLPAFACPSELHKALMAAAAFLFVGAGVLGVLSGLEELAVWRADPETNLVTYPAALLVCGGLCIPAGLAVLQLGLVQSRGELTGLASAAAPIPALTGLVWLFATHLGHGTDPVLMRYGWGLAAAALLTLAHYYDAGFLFGRCRPRRALFCALMGTFLGIISLADSPGRSTALLTAAFALSALAQSRALLRGVFGPPWPKRLLGERMPPAEEEKEL